MKGLIAALIAGLLMAGSAGEAAPLTKGVTSHAAVVHVAAKKARAHVAKKHVVRKHKKHARRQTH